MGRSTSWRFALVALLTAALGLPVAAATQPGGSFLDDDGSVHEPAIEAIRAAGITAGCDPVGDRFCPEASVTRAEMAAFLIRALGKDELTGVEASFSDVGTGRWYFGSVERLAALGISVGYPDGTFRPDAAVSRGEMAVFLVRALGVEPVAPLTGVFADIDPGAFHAGAVERIFELGVTLGCSTAPLRYCPAGAVSRAEMASFLARAFDLAQTPVQARPSIDGLVLEPVAVASGLSQPVFVTAPPGDDRLFIVEKGGRIRILANGSVRAAPFLDLSALVSTEGERGLLGLAFHPSYADSGRLFVHYTDRVGANQVVEYAVSTDRDRVDGSTARPLLTVPQPASNHNGGMIEFGPDGRLYVAIGDGGGSGDQFGNGQNPATRLGAITALDVNSGATSLFAFGLRNPWRFGWDGLRMYIGDVGQDRREEIDVISTYETGANLGWPLMEGSLCFVAGCSPHGLVLPLVEYSHAEGCSVVGGHVYRGSAIPALAGHYFYGDFCSGFVRSFRYTGLASDRRTWAALSTGGLVSFGVDGGGELYLVSIGGSVWRIESR